MIVECPKEGHATKIAGHYVSLGRAQDGRLLALITEGHPNAGDEKVTVCSVHVVQDRKEAAEWFAKELTEKPWLPRS